ncbi:MAG: DUF1641 domain-containing protein [Chloroflexi bacterium]|jgi:uncharacterized protein YjgD (DUF1641 family)|uniref:DUF1641 domain-containing protein n=1 Tax=Candidatus Thermofonsia Clade 3 bacterium TaxID=2364212 RepID=A0A2M8QBJ5_9CHLR|nr:DUF1641 domain-containing protein [Candidatus Roseilinea sp. NK_OTU-006]PJF47171.1 MAG: hypothetical protein CUN48_09980 [Candidatus Thermofonsia Clade 3 bacterium]RMG62476.1 MAG: DUF1641 domain-containing protein [Chloroflexota bacterium]
METELIRPNGATAADGAATVAELSRKIDALAAQVQYLTEQAQIAERERQARHELMRDLTPILNDVFRLSAAQLEEVQDDVDPADLLRLLKRLLRNGRNIEWLLDQLESVSDLADAAAPIGKDAFNRAVAVLAEMEQKGYFAFLKGGLRIVDNIVTSFTEEDVRQLGDNIVLILRTVKEMTQPEVMNFLRNTVTLTEQEASAPVDISYRALLAQMRDPNVRRGLALTMRMLSNIGAQATADSR